MRLKAGRTSSPPRAKPSPQCPNRAAARKALELSAPAPRPTRGPARALRVPAADHADLAFEAQHGDGAGAEGEPAAEGRGLLDPAGRERAQDVAVRDERDVAVG